MVMRTGETGTTLCSNWPFQTRDLLSHNGLLKRILDTDDALFLRNVGCLVSIGGLMFAVHNEMWGSQELLACLGRGHPSRS